MMLFTSRALRSFFFATMIAALSATGCAASSDPEPEGDGDAKTASAEKTPEAPPLVVDTDVHPEGRKHCHVLSMEDWWVVTGNVSEYGGMYCH